MKTLLTIAILLSFSVVAYAQRPLATIHKGNQLYNESRYDSATIQYMKGIEMDSNDMRGFYNLANTLYKQKNFELADTIYRELLNTVPDKSRRADIHHNLGNIAMINEDYKAAIENYKDALRLNPKKDDTKYNLAYALQKLQQNQGGGGGSSQDKKDDKKDDENKGQGQGQGQQKNDPQQQPSTSPSNQMKKEDAERMLNAIERQERRTLEKKDKIDAQRIRKDKDW